jgi:peptide/nickel transport system substrate-binding protein
VAPNRFRRSLLGKACASVALCAAPSALFFPVSAMAAPAKGGVANLAMVGEILSLDPMLTSSALSGTITQHIYEPLFTFDSKWNLAPMLAETMPNISKDGLVYTIALRHGVKFHNGKEMKSDDVVASLKRWMDMAPRGKTLATELKSIEAKGPYTVVISLKHPYAPLLSQLALPAGLAGIMPKEVIANPLTEFIGTAPYKFKERKPDQYLLLVRFDGYTPRKEPADGYAGKREALLDELRFVPVPNANTRVEGALSGQYQFADLLPVEANRRLDNNPNVKPIITAPFGYIYVVLNTKQGVMANLGVRQAFQEALNDTVIMTAAYGDKRFFSVEPNHYPKGSLFYSTAGADRYNQGDAKKAAAMLATAKYNGAPIRLLTSQQYDFHYRVSLVMAENLKQAGFKVDLQVVDWSTLLQRRNDPALWDVYVTHGSFLPEPMLLPPQLGNDAPGWWRTPAKDAVLSAFNTEIDPVKRGALWGQVQNLVYTEVPYMRLGSFNTLTAKSTKLDGYVPMEWPFFWNVGLKK